VPFDAAKIKELYPNHDAYVKAVKEDVAKLVKQRFLIREDGEDLIKAAQSQ